MADKKISALTASTTPLAGTEVLPIVQSGSTVQVSVANLTAGRAVAATSLQFGSGSVLSSYETGTWTPSLQFGGASTGITYVLQNGFYTKIGNIVSGTCWILLSSKGSATGDATIAGLPFANAAGDGNQSPSPVDATAITFINQMVGTVEKIFTYIKLRQLTNLGANNAITDANFGNTSSLQISFQYRAA